MNLNTKKKLAAKILRCSKKRVWLDPNRLDEIKEAITRVDLKSLIKDNAIKKKPSNSTSRFRIRKAKKQRSKGRKKGPGSRKGKKTARLPKKEAWMSNIRAQRELIKKLRDKKIIDKSAYKDIYNKSKGGFFRSARHIKVYIKEHKLTKK